MSLREVIETPVNHFHRQITKRAVQGFCDGIREIHQDRVEEPGRPYLNQDAIDGANPEIRQSQQPLDRVERIFDAPALPVECHHIFSGERLRIQHIRQVAIPSAARQCFDQPHRMDTLAICGASQLNDVVADWGTALQHRGHLIRRILFRACEEIHTLFGQLVKQRIIQETQIENQQCPGFECSKNPFPETLIVGVLVFFIPNLMGVAVRLDQAMPPFAQPTPCLRRRGGVPPCARAHPR
jgi:hypothetical protein